MAGVDRAGGLRRLAAAAGAARWLRGHGAALRRRARRLGRAGLGGGGCAGQRGPHHPHRLHPGLHAVLRAGGARAARRRGQAGRLRKTDAGGCDGGRADRGAHVLDVHQGCWASTCRA